jgi:hypothetical protein
MMKMKPGGPTNLLSVFSEWIKTKYGSPWQGMNTTLSLGTNTYPKTKEKALDALSNYKFKGRYYEVKKKTRGKMYTKPSEKSDEDDGENKKIFCKRRNEHMTCHCCGKKRQCSA